MHGDSLQGELPRHFGGRHRASMRCGARRPSITAPASTVSVARAIELDARVLQKRLVLQGPGAGHVGKHGYI